MKGKALVVLQAIVDKVNKITPTPDLESAAETTQNIIHTRSAWDSFIQLIGLLILLVLILIATYFTTRFVGNVKINQMKNSNFKVIDAYRLSPNKVIQIVQIGNKYIVLAICKDSVNYITELDEEHVVFREHQTRERVSFEQFLKRIRSNK